MANQITHIINFFWTLDIKISLSLLIILFSLINYFAEIYNYYHYDKLTVEEYKNNKDIFIKYLDNFYVRNIYYTTFAVSIYILGNIMPIFIIRIFKNNPLKNPNSSYPLEWENVFIDPSIYIKILGNILLFLLTMIILKKMLDSLFLREMYKIHIYLDRNAYYLKFTHKFRQDFFDDFLGMIYLFFFNISNLHIRSQKWDNVDLENYHEFNEYDTIYEHKKILLLSTKLVELSLRFRIVKIFMKILLKLFKAIYYRSGIYGLIRYLPYILYFPVVLYDFLHYEIFYSFYLFFPFYISIKLLELLSFLERRGAVKDMELHNYFYNNSFNYTTQRSLFLEDKLKYSESKKKSKENNGLFGIVIYNEIIEYIIGNFKEYIITRVDNDVNVNKVKAISKRYYYLIILGICLIALAFNNHQYSVHFFHRPIKISLVYLTLVVYIITIYISINILKSPESNVDNELDLYKYNRTFHIFYWILVFILGGIFYLTLVKSTIFLITDGILWEGFHMKILINYPMEEKIRYFHKYLDNLLEVIKFSTEGTTTIKIFIEESGIKGLIMEENTLKDIKLLIMEILDNYNNAVSKYNAFSISQSSTPINSSSVDIIDMLIIAILSIWILYSAFMVKLPILFLSTWGKSMMIALVRYEFAERAVDTSQVEDDFIWELAIRVLNNPGEYPVQLLYVAIKVKLGFV